MALAVRQTFESVVMTHLYPRSEIDIQIHVLQSDGGALHVCLNATTLALIDAGIALSDYVCACSAGLIDSTPVLGNEGFMILSTPLLSIYIRYYIHLFRLWHFYVCTPDFTYSIDLYLFAVFVSLFLMSLIDT
jgi:hypothetical protein